MPGLNNWVNITSNNNWLECSLDFTNFSPLSKKDAIEYNIEQIVKKYDNLFLCLSGGQDSEFVAKALHEHGIKFTPVIVDFRMNAAEVWFALRWCYENKVEPVVIKKTTEDMITEFPQIAFKYKTSFISSTDFIIEEYARERGGHVLTGTAEPFVRIPCFIDKLDTLMSHDLEINSYDFGLNFAFGDQHPSSFMTYTPQFFYSLVNDMNYDKPAQLAMSDYYGIPPRPKLDHGFNIILSRPVSEMSRKVNQALDLYNFSIGKKDDFLNKVYNKEIIHCVSKLKKNMN